ncbi:hypothetical protein [Mycobacterium sp. EPa45]|uniref:hypothetical protein n=1 Tax=Mycobacterium sp. EPa45 TaxID=1545728 RepID=UPI0006423FB5|nr:hypothetical protein [Mycobacterium sp. EPa45]AKK26951.1 hypothetical protein AB431_09995 [Mycobacterium sp. EPa45]
MARDTRGSLPPFTNGLHRVSLNPPHWRQGRRLIWVEALVTGVLGVVGLMGVVIGAQHDGWRVLGIPLTPALSVVMLVIAMLAGVSSIHRGTAKVFTLGMGAATVPLMIICSVAAVHHDPGPLGFTAPAILLWMVLFCWSIASAMWILPDQIEGAAWIPRRRSRDRTDSAMSTGRRRDS